MPFYRHRIGALTLTVLYDGTVDFALEQLRGIAVAEAEELQRAAFRPPAIKLPVVAFALGDGERLVMIDAGGAPWLDADLGHSKAAMAEAGLDPAQVSAVLLTHLHADHFGGLALESGEAAFPNARLVIPAADVPFRLEPTGELTAAQRVSVDNARRAVAPYQGRIDTITGGSPLPGLTHVPLPGHTPGHGGFRISDGGETLLIAGDVVHLPPVQFQRPDVGPVYDLNREQAQATRRALFAQAAVERLCLAGSHFDWPNIGHVIAAGEGFRFIATPMQFGS